MSWWDAGFSNFATQALKTVKTAQKKIDKVLDIQDEEESEYSNDGKKVIRNLEKKSTTSQPTSTTKHLDTDSFWNTWLDTDNSKEDEADVKTTQVRNSKVSSFFDNISSYSNILPSVNEQISKTITSQNIFGNSTSSETEVRIDEPLNEIIPENVIPDDIIPNECITKNDSSVISWTAEWGNESFLNQSEEDNSFNRSFRESDNNTSLKSSSINESFENYGDDDDSSAGNDESDEKEYENTKILSNFTDTKYATLEETHDLKISQHSDGIKEFTISEESREKVHVLTVKIDEYIEETKTIDTPEELCQLTSDEVTDNCEELRPIENLVELDEGDCFISSTDSEHLENLKDGNGNSESQSPDSKEEKWDANLYSSDTIVNSSLENISFDGNCEAQKISEIVEDSCFINEIAEKCEEINLSSRKDTLSEEHSEDEILPRVSEFEYCEKGNKNECHQSVLCDSVMDSSEPNESIVVKDVEQGTVSSKNENEDDILSVDEISVIAVDLSVNESISSRSQDSISDDLSESNRTLTSEDIVNDLINESEDSNISIKDDSSSSNDKLVDNVTNTVSKEVMLCSSISSSSSVKNMLEDAMTDSSIKESENTLIESDKGLDSTRLESDHNSEHTSGDEIDTTTSSDIEIISNPNSNGSDRQCDFSPNRRFSNRNPRSSSPNSHRRTDSSSSIQSNLSKASEDIVYADIQQSQVIFKDVMKKLEFESFFSDQQKQIVENEGLLTSDSSSDEALQPMNLLKKLAQMAEVVDAREKKLLQMSHENMELAETNNQLQNQIKHVKEASESKIKNSEELSYDSVNNLKEAEKQLSHYARENEKLLLQVEDSEILMAKWEEKLDRELKEKHLTISELMAEGEKLSKQQLQSNNIIKKLRAKEKETESVVKTQMQKIEKQKADLDQLHKAIDSKEEIERRQSDVLNQLNTTVSKQESEISRLKSDNEDVMEKLRATENALDNSYKDIRELHKEYATKKSEVQEQSLSMEQNAKEQLRIALEQEQIRNKKQEQTMLIQIEDLRATITQMQFDHERRENSLRTDISNLQQRQQDSEERNQELTDNVSATTRPLLRQIENLQSTCGNQKSAYEQIEQSLRERLCETQAQLASLKEQELLANEKSIEATSFVSTLESQVSILRQEKSRLTAQLQIERVKVDSLEEAKNIESSETEVLKFNYDQELEVLKKEKVRLMEEIEAEKIKCEVERKKVLLLQDQLNDKDELLNNQRNTRQNLTPSPTQQTTLSRISSSAAFINSSFEDDNVDNVSVASSLGTSHRLSLYEALREAGNSSVMESLEFQLKLQDGEIKQLQRDKQELERTREALARELVNLTGINDKLSDEASDYPDLLQKYKEMDVQYQALLQMYGEKVEETDELKLDLQDVKDMYKAQIEMLLKSCC